jgi:hypothetical protein
MGVKTAKTISWLFHPLIMSCVVLALLFRFDNEISLVYSRNIQFTILGMAFITTVLIPLLLVWFMFRLGIIRSFYMHTREERLFPLLAAAIFYYLTYYLLRGIHLPLIYPMYMLAATSLSILLIVVNFFMKVSLHMSGMGAVCGLFTGLVIHRQVEATWLVILAILLSGMVGTARLKLNTHQPAELYTGWMMGAILMFLTGIFF